MWRMANRTSPLRDATRLGVKLLHDIGRELAVSRIAAGMTQRAVAARLGRDQAHVSRVERGRIATLDVVTLTRHAAVVGLRPWVRLYPTVGRPLDAGQLALLGRLRGRLHPTWRMELEVPMPLQGDLRAADAVISIPGCRCEVEAITRLADVQMQLRAARLKGRDLRTDRVILLVAATHANRRIVRAEAALLAVALPGSTRDTLRALADGRDPGHDGLVLL